MLRLEGVRLGHQGGSGRGMHAVAVLELHPGVAASSTCSLLLLLHHHRLRRVPMLHRSLLLLLLRLQLQRHRHLPRPHRTHR